MLSSLYQTMVGICVGSDRGGMVLCLATPDPNIELASPPAKLQPLPAMARLQSQVTMARSILPIENACFLYG
jgi:hypothetical protein